MPMIITRNYLPALFLVSFIVFTSCVRDRSDRIQLEIPAPEFIGNTNKSLSEAERLNWYMRDIFLDTIPGISLNRAYEEGLVKNDGDTVVVAVLDMTIDISHEDLSDFIWRNKGEIAENGIDDDGNGYVDDTHGWNFIGWENGRSSEFVNYEYTRILRSYDSIFDQKEEVEIEENFLGEFNQYKRAKKAYEEQMTYARGEVENARAVTAMNTENKAILSKYIGETDLSLEILDSLRNAHPNEADLIGAIELREELLTYGIYESQIIEDELKAEERINKLLNLNYNDREAIGDLYPEDLIFNQYGNSKVDYNTSLLDHGTSVAGVIAANRHNEIGAIGITNSVKIMPLSISAYGDEHDKDIALAIRYAVDNGASIINMSSGKSFSLHKKWIQDAIRHAAEKDVLIITSAGNDGLNLDDKQNFNFPNDTDENYKEISSNFIKVGSTTPLLGINLYDVQSNYGSREVDIFAPGKDIYTLMPNNDYKYRSGTSFAAPVVAGVAALLRSYYPGLSAEEVKSIILKSGIEYNIMVNLNEDEEEEQLVPFNSLSKSGRIVNAYYALKYAEAYGNDQKN